MKEPTTLEEARAEIRRLQALISDACVDLRWYAVRQVDLSSRQTFLNRYGPEWSLAKDQDCWADALLDEINEFEWEAKAEAKE